MTFSIQLQKEQVNPRFTQQPQPQTAANFPGAKTASTLPIAPGFDPRNPSRLPFGNPPLGGRATIQPVEQEASFASSTQTYRPAVPSGYPGILHKRIEDLYSSKGFQFIPEYDLSHGATPLISSSANFSKRLGPIQEHEPVLDDSPSIHAGSSATSQSTKPSGWAWSPSNAQGGGLSRMPGSSRLLMPLLPTPNVAGGAFPHQGSPIDRGTPGVKKQNRERVHFE